MDIHAFRHILEMFMLLDLLLTYFRVHYQFYKLFQNFIMLMGS